MKRKINKENISQKYAKQKTLCTHTQKRNQYRYVIEILGNGFYVGFSFSILLSLSSLLLLFLLFLTLAVMYHAFLSLFESIFSGNNKFVVWHLAFIGMLLLFFSSNFVCFWFILNFLIRKHFHKGMILIIGQHTILTVLISICQIKINSAENEIYSILTFFKFNMQLNSEIESQKFYFILTDAAAVAAEEHTVKSRGREEEETDLFGYENLPNNYLPNSTLSANTTCTQ